MKETILVTILGCEKETEKAYLLRMPARNRTSGENIIFEDWWPKSQVRYAQGDREIEVPEWLLERKIEERFGPTALVEIG